KITCAFSVRWDHLHVRGCISLLLHRLPAEELSLLNRLSIPASSACLFRVLASGQVLFFIILICLILFRNIFVTVSVPVDLRGVISVVCSCKSFVSLLFSFLKLSVFLMM